MVMSTVSDAVTATPFKNDSPKINMPSSAMQTVEPAKSTARPDVFNDVMTASSTVAPRFSS
jgi:hypothetical protein